MPTTGTMNFALIAVFFAGLVALSRALHNDFVVTVDEADASYRIHIGGHAWLKSAPTFVTAGGKTYSSDSDLKLVSSGHEDGIDILGEWEAKVFFWTSGKYNASFKTIVKRYVDPPLPMVLFGQHYMDEVEGTSMGDRMKVSSGFPSFSVDNKTGLGFLAYGGIMVGDTHKSMGMWGTKDMSSIASGLDSGPLVLFKAGGDTLVISPFSSFMASSAVYDTKAATASWGLIGTMKSVPKDFHYWTVAFYCPGGINMAIEEWGLTLRKYYNKPTSFRDSDLTNNYIGYWTDNGAYYYYKTEDQKTYEQSMIDVRTYGDQLKLPYRYIQYDSWWYYKGPHNGVTEWVSTPKVFPSGAQSLWNKTGWPVSAHNRWWSDKTVYAKQNGGKYNFIIETHNNKAIPQDQEFWDFLMMSSRNWGMIVYEQDWLNDEFDGMDVTLEDVWVGHNWLLQMGNGAAKSGVTIQYCMSPSRSALQSLLIPVVTQARVSGDYQPGNDQWRIGISSMFAHGIGIAPFKDNFWTTTDQPGNPYGKKEPYPALQSVVATLSTGPVGPSDKIGYSNATLIVRTCNAEGRILKPSRPATAIDAQVLQAAFHSTPGLGPQGEVWSTYSDIAGWKFGIVLAADLKNSYKLTPSAAGFSGPSFPASRVWKRDGTKLDVFSNENPVNLQGCTMTDFCLYYTTPIFYFQGRELLLMGEVSKWVPMSPQRVKDITVGTDDAVIKLTGMVGEQVSFHLVHADTPLVITCTIGSAGSATISLVRAKCV